MTAAASSPPRSAPAEVKQGAFEAMEAGRTCDISAACHWAVNMAASASTARCGASAYSMTPAGIYVAPESPIRRPEDLLGRRDRRGLPLGQPLLGAPGAGAVRQAGAAS